MPTLTLDRARAIVAHAENEFATDKQIDDAFAPFARGGASTREDAVYALYIVIADFYRIASCPGSGAGAMQEFSNYARLSSTIALRITYAAILDPTALQQASASDTRETVESFVCYLRTLTPNSLDFWPAVYQRIGLSYPEEPRIGSTVSAAPTVNKPWWKFW